MHERVKTYCYKTLFYIKPYHTSNYVSSMVNLLKEQIAIEKCLFIFRNT